MLSKEINLNNFCNNNCVFCKSLKKKSETNKSYNKVVEELRGAKREKINEIIFPCNLDIRKDFFSILQQAKKFRLSVTLETNGRIFSYRSYCERVAKYVNHFVVYFPHKDSSSYDAITSVKNSLEQTIRGIKNLLACDATLSVNIPILNANYKSLAEIIRYLADLGVKEAIVDYIDFEETPKFSDLLPYLYRAFHLKNQISIKIKNIPLCFLNDFSDHLLPGITKSKVKALQCKNCKYDNRCEGIWKNYVWKFDVSEVEPVKDLPLEIDVELTQKCNLSCLFCFNKNRAQKNNKKELTTKQVLGVVDKIKNFGISKVRFTGGEVFLRKDLEEILAYAKAKELYVIINTNGTLIRNVNIIKKYVDDTLFSLNGYNPETEYKITGLKDSFKRKMRAIKRLEGSKIFVRICTVATKETIHNLEKFYKLIKSLPINNWFLLRLLPNKININPIDKFDVKELVEKIFRLNKKYNMDVTIRNALPFCSYDPEKVSVIATGALHDDGHSRLVIDSQGHIKPSYYSSKTLGNIKTDDLSALWNSPYMKKIRNLELIPPECKHCTYLDKCKGGSRFAAEFVTESAKALDPLAHPTELLQNTIHN